MSVGFQVMIRTCDSPPTTPPLLPGVSAKARLVKDKCRLAVLALRGCSFEAAPAAPTDAGGPRLRRLCVQKKMVRGGGGRNNAGLLLLRSSVLHLREPSLIAPVCVASRLLSKTPCSRSPNQATGGSEIQAGARTRLGGGAYCSTDGKLFENLMTCLLL